MSRFRISRLSGATAAITAFLVFHSAAEAQQAPRRVAVGLDLAAPVAPLNKITVPDVNVLGILDGTVDFDSQGIPLNPGADKWPDRFGEPSFNGPITKPGQRTALQQLGKALFWDMQVGGDGIQSCASCHYHAGADNRITNQMSPGIKMTAGGLDVPASKSDKEQDLVYANGVDPQGANGTLIATDFGDTLLGVGLPVSEAALIAAGSTRDGVDGTSGVPSLHNPTAFAGSKPDAGVDVNDVVSSQGVRLGKYEGLSDGPVDAATLAVEDEGFDGFGGFTVHQRADITSPPVETVRRVEPRNSPTTVNAVYHMRNFWDGRADMFFNGVTPLGFRDPDAAVKVKSGDSLVDQKLRIPFSSLASQAVGPIESDFEMVFAGRPHRDLGKKLLATGVVPLAGQTVSCSDSLLGELIACDSAETSKRGLSAKNYKVWIQDIFDARFWNGPPVCTIITTDGNDDEKVMEAPCNSPDPTKVQYTHMEWNFSLFFGLAVQAYEATLTTEQTIVDLLVGGIATGTVTNETRDRRNRVQSTVTVPVTGLPLQGCIAAAALANNAGQQAAATELCIRHYAQWIHPKARAGSQAGATAFPVDADTPIGGCVSGTRGNTTTTLASNGTRTFSLPCGAGSPPNGGLAGTVSDILASVQAIDRGMGRFFAGATGCAICHFNPEFTGATVAALTGFGAAPPPPLPPGQLRRVPLEVPMERMVAFNGAPAVYDAGFYNLGIRPTPEDISLGDQIGGVPLAFSKLAEQIQIFLGAGSDPEAVQVPYEGDKIEVAAAELGIAPTNDIPTGTLFIPTSATDLTPRPWTLALACGPGVVGNGNGNGNNNPIPQCVPNVIPGERLLRNGAFKAQGLRNVKYTGPYFHNGAKLNLSQVVNTYETAGHFTNLNLNNLDAGMRIFDLGPTDTAALIELMETGLTDWRLAHEEDKFDHPEICVPHGHDPATGKTILVGIPAVGSDGNDAPLATFEEIANGAEGHTHDLTADCTVTGVADANGLSLIDVPPAPPPAPPPAS